MELYSILIHVGVGDMTKILSRYDKFYITVPIYITV